jgi:hypothetical protein
MNRDAAFMIAQCVSLLRHQQSFYAKPVAYSPLAGTRDVNE